MRAPARSGIHAAIRVLLVEDDRLQREAMSGLLAGIRPAWRIEAVDRLSKALARLAAFPTDVVLLDLTLPDSEELGGLRQIRQAHPTLPVVVVTAVSDEEVALEAMAEGAQDYLVKGHFDAEALARAALHAVERERAQAALLKSEERYRRLVAEDLSGICRLDAAGRIRECNQSFAEMFGFSSTLAAESGDFALLLRDVPGGGRELAAIGEEGLQRQELAVRRCDGSVGHFVATLSPELDGAGLRTGFRGYFFDESNRKRAEDQLRQSQKMEAVGRLAGGVAHDFNNLLTAINGYAELLQLRLTDDPAARADLEEIRRAGERAAALTRQLLAFSRRQVLAPKVLDLGQVVASLEGMLRRLIGEDVELVNAASSDLWPVRADPGQLEQVVMNLAVNARDAMPAGGRLTLATVNLVVTVEEAVRLPGMVPGEYAVLVVADTGHGMDAEVKRRLFEPFFTTKGRGTGLGLSMVYGIVKQSDGYIEVQSEPGQGATFRVYLPRVRREEPAAATGSPPGAAAEAQVAERAAGGGERVLVAEDDAAVRALVVEALSAHGYRVREAGSGQAAAALAASAREPFHLLVTDVVMPDMRGPELERRVRQVQPAIRVLYISGYDDGTLQRGALDQGAAFLQKPFGPSELARRVRELLDVEP